MAHASATWLRKFLLVLFGCLGTAAFSQDFTARAAPEPVVRSLRVVPDSPIPGQTSIWATGFGAGLFRGVDDGTSINWTPIGASLPTTRLFSTYYLNDSIFYVMTDGYGVQKTVNGGTSFTAANGAGATGLGCVRARIMQRVVSGPTTTIYVGTECDTDSGVWSSTNDGATWTRLGTGVIPADAAVNTILANGTILMAATTRGVFRSADSGATWSPANGGLDSTPGLGFPNAFNIVCGASCGTLMLTNVQGQGVYRSVDSGQSWSTSSTGLPSGPAMAAGLTRDNVSSYYYVAIDGEAVYESTDEGASWHVWGTTATNDEVSYPRQVIRDGSVAGKYYVATFAGVSRTTDSGVNWYTGTMGRGTYNSIMIDNSVPFQAFAAGVTALRIPNWLNDEPELAGTGLKGVTLGGAIYQVLNSSDTIYVTTDNFGPYVSLDHGDTWVPRNNGLPRTIGQSGRLTFDRVNPLIIYYGSNGQNGIGIYKTTDGGLNWVESNAGLPAGPARSVNRILVDRVTASTMFAATGAGVYKSVNSGATWTALYNPTNAGVALPTAQIMQSTVTATELYIANDHVAANGTVLASSGVLKSINGGTTWTKVIGGRAQSLRVLNNDTIFAGFSDGPGTPPVKRSSNKGVTWTALTGFNGSDLRTFGITPDNAALIMVSLENGIYTQNAMQYVFFASPTYTVTEGGSATITVTRTGNISTPGTVNYGVIGGTATAGSDFTSVSGTLSFAANVANLTFTVPTTNDAVLEGEETVVLRLTGIGSTNGNLGYGSTPNTTLTINDNDSVISFDGSAVSVSESGPNVVLTLTRSGAVSAAQAVTFTTANGTATAGTDFGTTSAQVTGTVTFAPGETTKTIAVGPAAVAVPYIRVINDALVEGPETFTVTLSAPTNNATLGVSKVATVTINSDENGVSMAVAARAVNEGDGAVEIFANRAGTNGAVDVSFSFVNGTAQNGPHFEGTPGTLHWNDGESGTKSIFVNVVNDGAPNTARTFTVTLAGATGAVLTTPSSTIVTVADNDNTVQFTAPTASVNEGVATVTLTVSRTGITTQSANVTWTAANGSGIAGTDYGVSGNTTPPTGNISWAGGDAASKTVVIPILNNSIVSGVRNFTVTLSLPTGANLTIGANPTSTVAINDDDKGLKFEFAGYEVTEGAGVSATIRVLRVGPVTTAAAANWVTVNGSAISGTDFGVANTPAARSGALAWPANDATAKTITIPILNNTIGGQPDRTFNVNLTPGAGYVLAGPGSVTVSIHDDDIPPQSAVTFSAPKQIVMENGGSVVLTLERGDVGGGFGLAASVKYSTVPGTALATSDYTAVTNGTVTWAAGDSTDKTITIPIVNNATPESLEAFTVVLSSPSAGLGFGSFTTSSVLIMDDDEAFPLDGAMPAGFGIPGGVTTGWHVSNEVGAYEGVYTLKTDEIENGQQAGLEMNGTFAAGNVSFRVKVSSEATFDVLTFYVDGVAQPLTWSGTAVAGWQQSPTYPITAGAHTLKWIYSKDQSASMGADAVHLDGLITPAFTPAP